MKTIVVTDIHGCLEELESVLAQAGFDSEADKLICLGDLMDRGPYSFGVFDRFRSLPDGCEIRDRRHLTPLRSITVIWKNSFAGSMKCVRIMRMMMLFLFMLDWCMRSQKKILCMI